MFLNDSHIKRDWLDVDSKSQQPSMKKAENSTAGLYCITIKDFSPRECHYLSTSIYVQMAPNLLLKPPPTGSVCVRGCSHCMGLCTRYLSTQSRDCIKILRKFVCLSIVSKKAVARFQTEWEAAENSNQQYEKLKGPRCTRFGIFTLVFVRFEIEIAI